MTPEAQRIAIAEACGWQRHATIGPIHGQGISQWRHPDGAFYGNMDIPDYLHDLNAMHEAEKVLDGFQLREYGDHLQKILRWFIVGYIEQDYKGSLAKLARIAHATAAQRAEAFLRTIGKWEAEANIKTPTSRT